MASIRRASCACFVVVSALFAACGGSDDSAVSVLGGDAGSSDSSIGDGDGGIVITDGSLGDDGAASITDGGANFGEGGSGDGGDFPDGGTCNRIDMGSVIMSDCSAISPVDFGGALVAGDYTLTKVTDLGTFNFCNKSFKAVPFQGGLKVEASLGSSAASTIELALDGDATGRKSFTWTALPASTNKSPLGITQTCPSAATFSLPYSSYSAGKQILEIVAPYGSGGGTATYHFEKN